MKKFRTSYSMLSAWEAGNIEQAVAMHLRKYDSPPSKAMLDGLHFHKRWATDIMREKLLPMEFGAGELIKPQAELKIVKELTDDIQLVGVVDCYDEPTIYEFKTGRQSSITYSGTKQHLVYHLLLDGVPTKTVYMHYDQYSNKSDSSIVHLVPELTESTTLWVVGLAESMVKYLKENNLYEV